MSCGQPAPDEVQELPGELHQYSLPCYSSPFLSLTQPPSLSPLLAFAALYHQESSFAPLPTAGELHLLELCRSLLTQPASDREHFHDHFTFAYRKGIDGARTRSRSGRPQDTMKGVKRGNKRSKVMLAFSGGASSR